MIHIFASAKPNVPRSGTNVRTRSRMPTALAVVVGLALTCPADANDSSIIPPDVVQIEKVHINGDVKTVVVGNATRHYVLNCNIQSLGCITPSNGENYFLFDKTTRWKMPLATEFIDLKFVQNWTVKYDVGENIGLVPLFEKNPVKLGMYVKETGGDYEHQDTVATDGPIIYGTGLSETDRKEAWRYFFLLMVRECERQQGKDALERFEVALNREC